MTTEITRHEEATLGQSAQQQRQKLLEVTIDTDGSGDGSITVDFSEYFDGADELKKPFATTPWAFIEQSSDSTASISNLTADSMDISVSGTTASSTVTVRALVLGDRGGRA